MQRHYRFFIALVLGLIILGLMQFTPVALEMRVLAAVDVFYFSYLVMMLRLNATATPADLRRLAESEDEGMPMIVVLSSLVLVISLTAIISALNGPAGGGLTKRILALISVPMGWVTIQTLASFHYANLYYRPVEEGTARPLIFPGGEEPDPWDFMYFAFVLAMCAQVSDVTTNSSAMRRAVLLHSVSSFFYNAFILALVVAAITADL
jgi:uncharacterized membrane protein